MKTRNKLMAAAVMLVISILMMSTASFAWFSISTAPEAKIKTQVVANGNLEIALDAGTSKTPAASATDDAGKNTTWGALVDLGETVVGQLKPVQADASGLKYPVYGDDGRISKLEALSVKDTTSTAGVTQYKITDGGEVWAIQLNLWLRTNVAGNISISGDSTLVCENAAVKIAYSVGTAVTGDETSATAAFTPTSFTAINVDASTDKLTETAIISTAAANQSYPVSVLIFLDGTQVTNATMANAVQAAALSLKFTHSVTLDPMEKT